MEKVEYGSFQQKMAKRPKGKLYDWGGEGKFTITCQTTPTDVVFPDICDVPTVKSAESEVAIAAVIDIVARNSSNALSSADFSLNYQVTIVDRHIGS